MVPNGLTMTSPASRQTSAQAMTQDSARVTPGSLTVACRSATLARYSSSSTKT